MKVANGLSLRKSKGRFKSKLMMKLVKEWQKHRANMKCMNLSKSNHNIYVVAEGANITSPNNSNIWPTSALVAKNSNSRYVLASKRASQPPTLWLENSLNSSSDFKCSKPSIVRNALPSKTPKASVSWKSKDDSNAIPRHLEQSHRKKTSRASRTRFKAMPNLIHKAKNVDTSNLNDVASGSRWRGQSDSYKGEDINTGKEGTKTSEMLKSREVSRKSNILVVYRMDPNKDEPDKMKGSQDEVVIKEEGVKGHTCEGRATCGKCHKQANNTKTNDAPNLGSLLVGNKHMQGLMSNLRENSSHLFEKNHSRHQRDDPCEYRETNLKLPNRVQSVGGNGKTNDVISRRKRLMLEEKARTHVQKNLTYGPMKRRRYIEANEDEEDYVGDHHPVHITTELTPQDSISKHCVERQCYCCSKPIDIPRWSGIFKIDGKENISLAGHLSSKSCEKVWKLSSLPEVVQVTKVPRMAVWPKIFKASKPTGDDIGLYFFPSEMRHDELDQLVNEVMDKDLILRAVIGEAEMLIFPSVLLPERYQTFQTKHYLWGAFKAKADKGDVIVEQEDEKEKCVSNLPDEVQSEEPDPEMNVPTEAASAFPSNHGLVRPSMEAPPQSGSVFGIVVRQSPNLEPEVKQFIQEMERKGALVTVMRGEAIGGGPWPSNITTTMQ